MRPQNQSLDHDLRKIYIIYVLQLEHGKYYVGRSTQ